MTRSLTINQEKNYARFFDTFTNESRSPLSVDVDFGGQLGYNLTTSPAGNHQSAIFATSSGDTAATPADTWVANDTPSEPGNLASASRRPLGDRARQRRLVFTQTSDFLTDPFNKPLQTSGDEANTTATSTTSPCSPGRPAHWCTSSSSVSRKEPNRRRADGIPAAGSQTTAVKTLADELAATPDLSGLTTGQLCSIGNWTEASIKAFKPTYNPAECVGKVPSTRPRRWSNSRNRRRTRPKRGRKSITEELAAMEGGETTSAQITKAYLDRIAAYNGGPLGFHA